MVYILVNKKNKNSVKDVKVIPCQGISVLFRRDSGIAFSAGGLVYFPQYQQKIFNLYYCPRFKPLF